MTTDLISNTDSFRVGHDLHQIFEVNRWLRVEVVDLEIAEALSVEIVLQHARGFIDHAL